MFGNSSRATFCVRFSGPLPRQLSKSPSDLCRRHIPVLRGSVRPFPSCHTTSVWDRFMTCFACPSDVADSRRRANGRACESTKSAFSSCARTRVRAHTQTLLSRRKSTLQWQLCSSVRVRAGSSLLHLLFVLLLCFCTVFCMVARSTSE